MSLWDGIVSIAETALLLVLLLWGFKLFRWVVAIIVGLNAGLLAALVASFTVARETNILQAGLLGIFGAGGVAFLLVGTIAFLLTLRFQHFAAAITGALSIGGVVYAIVWLSDQGSKPKGNNAQSLGLVLAVVFAVAAAVIVVKLYDYFAAAWVAYWFWTVSDVAHSLPTVPSSSDSWVATLLSRLQSLVELLAHWQGGIIGFLWHNIFWSLVVVSSAVLLRHYCWRKHSKKVTKLMLRGQLKPLLWATAILILWARFCELTVQSSPLLLTASLWAGYVMLVVQGHKRHVAVQGTSDVALGFRWPARRAWLEYSVVAIVGVPLVTLVAIGVGDDLPKITIGLDTPLRSVLVAKYYAATLLSPVVNDLTGRSIPWTATILQWVTGALVVPLLLDRAGRRAASTLKGASSKVIKTAEETANIEQQSAVAACVCVVEKGPEQPVSSENRTDERKAAPDNEFGRQSPPATNQVRKLGWAIGIAGLCIAGAIVLVGKNSLSQTSHDNAAGMPTPPAQARSAPTASVSVSQVARPISASASSFIGNAGGKSGGPEQAIDGDPKTAWQSGRGTGQGEWLELQFAPGTQLNRVNIATGYDTVSDKYGDLFRLNAHVRALTVFVDDQMLETRHLQDGDRNATFVLDRTVQRLRFRIDEVYPGEKWKNDLCVSEVTAFATVINRVLSADVRNPKFSACWQSPAPWCCTRGHRPVDLST